MQRSSLLVGGTTKDLAPGRFEEKDESKNGCLSEWRSGSHHAHQTTALQKWMSFLPKTFLQIILAVKAPVQHSSKERLPNNSDTAFDFPSVRFLFSHGSKDAGTECPNCLKTVERATHLTSLVYCTTVYVSGGMANINVCKKRTGITIKAKNLFSTLFLLIKN